MTRERVIETNQGIQDDRAVREFNRFQRDMRDRGLIPTKGLLRRGIRKGRALEIGPGPGYLGLEWLKNSEGTCLTALEISPAMIAQSRTNAREYGLEDRVEYLSGTALAMPFGDGGFDAVFSSGSLHEWEDPLQVFREAHRVLKPGGRLYVTDMRRDTSRLICRFMQRPLKGSFIKEGFWSSLNAAYTLSEITEILEDSPFRIFRASRRLFGLEIYAEKERSPLKGV